MKHDILGEVVKAARKHKGLSQEQLAELLDCSPRHIMAIENEGKKPSYWRLYNLIRTLNIPAERVFYPEHDAVLTEKDNRIKEILHLLYKCNSHDLQIILLITQGIINIK